MRARSSGRRASSADLQDLVSNNQLVATTTHEMAHVLGFGILWPDFGFTSDSDINNPIFTGPEAVALWPPFATALGYTGRPVPLEACCGDGVRDVHWRKSVFQAELMTGFLEPPGVPTPLSKMTIATMEDLGYQVDYAKADLFVGHLATAPSSGAAATRINERLRHATWQVSPDGAMRRIPRYQLRSRQRTSEGTPASPSDLVAYSEARFRGSPRDH